MCLYDDLRAGGYLDPTYGMVSNRKHESSQFNCDNYWLFSALAMICAGWKSWPGAARFYLQCRVEPGLIRRFPGRNDDVSQQELVGAAALDTAFAIQIEHYGFRHFYCYNVVNPGKFSLNYFYFRFIDFAPFLWSQAICLLGCLGIPDLLWAIGIITTALTKKSNTSEKVYKWLQVERRRHSGRFLIAFAIGCWVRLMERKYPGGPRELLGIYFYNADPNHPIPRYAPLRF